MFGGLLFFLKGAEEPEEADTDQAPAEHIAPRSVSEVGRVMTEEEYEEWKKEREGSKEHEQDGGIDWGMGEIKTLKTLPLNYCCRRSNVLIVFLSKSFKI